MKHILVIVAVLAIVACNGKNKTEENKTEENKTEIKEIITTLTESLSIENSIEGRWILPVNFEFYIYRMTNDSDALDAMIQFSNDTVFLELWVHKKIMQRVYWGTYTLKGSTINITNRYGTDVLKYKWAGADLIIADRGETLEQASEHFTRYTGPVENLNKVKVKMQYK